MDRPVGHYPAGNLGHEYLPLPVCCGWRGGRDGFMATAS